MDCKNARLLLEFIRPGGPNLDADEAEAVEQHLADCPDCGLFARDERRADDHLGRAMRAVPIPPGLRQRILQRLPPGPLPWYRRWGWWGLSGGAAAAVLLIGLGGLLASRGWLDPPPAVDINQVYEQANRQLFLPKPEAVQKDFKEKWGVEMKAPPQFNYQLLNSYGLVVFEGRQVPQLLFLAPRDKDNPPALARVYVLSSRQFDLEKTRQNGTTTPSGSLMVRLEEHPEGDRDYLYLVVFNGHSLEPFFRRLGAG